MSYKTYNTPEEVAADLPEEIAKKYLQLSAGSLTFFSPRTMYQALDHAVQCCAHIGLYEHEKYWTAIRERAGEFDPKGEEPKGVFIDIKVNAELPLPSLDEIKDEVAKEYDFMAWGYLVNFINKDIPNDRIPPWPNICTMVAFNYGTAVSAHERQRAERVEKENIKMHGLIELTLQELENHGKIHWRLYDELKSALAEKGDKE